VESGEGLLSIVGGDNPNLAVVVQNFGPKNVAYGAGVEAHHPAQPPIEGLFPLFEVEPERSRGFNTPMGLLRGGVVLGGGVHVIIWDIPVIGARGVEVKGWEARLSPQGRRAERSCTLVQPILAEEGLSKPEPVSLGEYAGEIIVTCVGEIHTRKRERGER
jgi:hypothetical protein